LDERGRASFERLQRRFTQTDPDVIDRLVREIPVVLYAFDLLFAAGRYLRGLPLETRKAILARMTPRLGFVRFADHVVGDGRALYEAVRSHDLEGIVAKRANSRYEAGRRSRAWRKIKVPRESPLVIVGALPGRGARAALGSLMLGGYEGERLVYAGNVGSGLDDATVATLEGHLEAAHRDAPAFEGAPEPASRGTVYVEPELVCRVGYTEVTEAGLLRHPVFKGLAPDVAPEDCRAPRPRAAEAEVSAPVRRDAPLELTRLDKVFWPVEGYTKGDLLAYYEAAWLFLAPYLHDRPVVLTRYPDGIEGKSFYQKNAPDFTPEWARRERIEQTDYFVCNDLRTLLYVINSGAIPLHVWSARLGQLDRPDWLILDLDPKHVAFVRVVELARHLHRLLDALGAAHFVKTSGQDGLHVMLPLAGRLDHDEARTLAEVLARVLCAERPDLATVVRPLAARGDKVYVDFLQNGRGKLIAAPFSVRPRPHAPVSMPLTWAQVSSRLDPARWTLRTALRRIERHGDPLRGVLGEGVDVEALLAALGERLERAR
jgi:bifunctional non-homologous end joining protein LigD